MTDSWRATEKPDIVAVLRVTDGWRTTEKSVTKGNDLCYGEAFPFKFIERTNIMIYSKEKAISIIHNAANIFNEQLCNKNLLVIYGPPSSSHFIEIKSLPRNFLHLTGLIPNNLSANRFYQKALSRKIESSDFEFKNSTTEQKLRILNQALQISTNTKMVGDFNNGRLNLQTDKLAGSISSCMGFLKIGEYYVPNTVLEDNIKKNVSEWQKALAIVCKSIDEPNYNKITYIAKGIDVQKLLQKLSQQVSIDEKLLTSSSPNIDAASQINKISYVPISYSGGAAVLSPAAPGENIRSIFDKVKNGIVGAMEKKAKKPSTNNETELRTLKEQLLQKDEEIAQKDRTIAKKSEEIAKKGNLINDLIKASEAITEEKNKLSEIAKNQRNKIHQINSWLNANPDIKERLLKDKKEHRSVFASSPTENSDRINTKLSDISDSKVKQTHKPKNKKSL